MIRRAGAALAVVGLLAACGNERAAEPPPTAPPATAVDAPPAPPPPPPPVAAPAPEVHVKPRAHKVLVAVVDGDTGRPVGGARVTIGRRSDLANRNGIAAVIAKRRPLVVRASARGYLPRKLRLPFQRRPFNSLRIYRRDLQWTMYGGSPARTQTHRAIRVRPPFRVVWSRGLGGLVEFPAVVSEGVAYIGNFHGTIYAVSMRTGKVAWKYDPPGGKMASSPAIVGDDLVVHGMDGWVRVLDRRNGRLRWQLSVGSPIESSPIVRGGVDYFGAWNGTVYALDLKRRAFRWTYRGGYKITSSAAIAGATLFIGDYGGRLLALSPRSGALRWARSVNGRVYGTPAVGGGRVFVPSSTGGSLTAFSTGGRSLWSVRTGSYVYSSPAVWRGRVYFGSYNGLLYCVSARSGRRLWSVGVGGPISGAPAVVAGVVYAGSTASTMLGADARTGRVVFRFPHGEYVPVSGGGARLLLHGYSRLYAVEPTPRRRLRAAKRAMAAATR